jgi:hypothetical protein
MLLGVTCGGGGDKREDEESWDSCGPNIPADGIVSAKSALFEEEWPSVEYVVVEEKVWFAIICYWPFLYLFNKVHSEDAITPCHLLIPPASKEDAE